MSHVHASHLFRPSSWASGNNVPSEGRVKYETTSHSWIHPRSHKLDPRRFRSLNRAFCHHKGEGCQNTNDQLTRLLRTEHTVPSL